MILHMRRDREVDISRQEEDIIWQDEQIDDVVA